MDRLRIAPSVLSADFSRDGTRIATGCRDQIARIWDAATGELLRQLPHESQRGVRSGRRSYLPARTADGGGFDRSADNAHEPLVGRRGSRWDCSTS